MKATLSPEYFLVFLLPFHVVGGAVAGVALRRIAQKGFQLSSLAGNGFMLVWGLIFGGIPLLFGVSIGPVWFRLVQWGLFLGSILFVALGLQWLRDLYSQPGMFIATFGFFFMVIGLVVASLFLQSEDLTGLLLGLIFGGIGGVLTMAGVWMLLRTGR